MALRIPTVKNRMGKVNTQTANTLVNGARPTSIPVAQKPVVAPQFKLGTTLDELNAQKAHAATQANTAGWNARRSSIDTAISGLTPQPQIPTATAAQPTTQPAPVAAQPVAAPQPVMRTAYDFAPTQMEQDPIYKFQKEQGLSELDNYLASKGLRQSGARDRAASRLIGQLGSDAYKRQLDTAGTEADRYERMTNNESGRLERAGQNQFNNLMSVLNLSASQSPMAAGYSATDSSANNAMKQGGTLADFLGQMYKKSIASGGGGGGAYTAPFPGSPDFTQADYAAMQGNIKNKTGWTDLASKFLGAMFQ